MFCIRPSDFRRGKFWSNGDLELVFPVAEIETAAVGQIEWLVRNETLTGGKERAVRGLEILQYGTATLQADAAVTAADTNGAAGKAKAAALVAA